MWRCKVPHAQPVPQQKHTEGVEDRGQSLFLLDDVLRLGKPARPPCTDPEVADTPSHFCLLGSRVGMISDASPVQKAGTAKVCAAATVYSSNLEA